MNLIPFGKVWCASGARGFFGEGYWYSGFRLNNTTLVTKTFTYHPKTGNMSLDGHTPKEWWPDCIKINFRKGAVLNAVGLSNPGAEYLFDQGKWQLSTRPTILSFMCNDIQHTLRFVELLRKEKFRTPIALQMNFSCPNIDFNVSENIQDHIDIASSLCLPLIPKVSCRLDLDIYKELKGISALCISNTIPWGQLPNDIDWHGLFGEISPLAKYGGGGISGAPLIPLLWNRLWRTNFPFPIIATAGQSIECIDLLQSVGVDIFEIGTITMLRPWRVKGMIKRLS